jgi:hypothetical protein
MKKMDEGKKQKQPALQAKAPVCNCQCKCACGDGGAAVDANNFDQAWATNSSTQP